MSLVFCFVYASASWPCIKPTDPSMRGELGTIKTQYQNLLQVEQSKTDAEERNLASLGAPPEPSASRTENALLMGHYRSSKEAILEAIKESQSRMECLSAVVNALEKLEVYNNEINILLAKRQPGFALEVAGVASFPQFKIRST